MSDDLLQQMAPPTAWPLHLEHATCFTVPKGDGLDALTVFMLDRSRGTGLLVVECFGTSWSAWWTGMGDLLTWKFISRRSVDYLTSCLLRNSATPSREIDRTRADEYCCRVVRRLLWALRAYEAGVLALGEEETPGGAR